MTNLPSQNAFAVPPAPAMMENPRHRLISARVSPMVEMARWIFELYNIPYAEQAHAPVIHVLATLRSRGGYEVPVVVGSEGVWRGAPEFLVGFDAKSPPSNRLLGRTAAERTENIAFIDELFALLLKQVRRYVYFHLLPHRRILSPVAVDGAPAWERFVVETFYPLWRRLMGKALDFSPNLIEEAPVSVRRAFDIVEERLADGRRFLGGDEPGILDIVFSSLAAPVVFPTEYGAMLPAIDDLPVELRNFVTECRSRRAGELVLETYRIARTQPQRLLRYEKRKRGFVSYFFGRRMRVRLAKLLVRFAPRLVVGRFAVVSRWDYVQEVLKRDTEFLIAPINGPRIEEINGPFVLGMDRGEVMEREQRHMYAALSTVDFDGIRAQVRAEAELLLEGARKTRERKIEVVNGYARLVAARTAISLFGVSGPSEAEYMRVARWIFHHTFLNFQGDERVRAKALSASKDLRSWVLAEIEKRKSGAEGKSDLMSALLAQQSDDPTALDDDGIRRTLMGMLVGAVDTTATAVAHCTSVLLSDARLRESALANAHDSEKFLGWCWEALRFHPHNGLLLRHAVVGTDIFGKKVGRDTTVILNTLGAMHDPVAFPSPGRLDPARPVKHYLHFGGGLHACAGRAINAVQVPELVKQLLVNNATTAGAERFDGPFIDGLSVRLTRKLT
jgi:cytochrome P450/glutathione S-transferase